MNAVISPNASIELAEFLIAKGAQVSAISSNRYEPGRSVLSLAIKGGNPKKVALLLKHGANVFYTSSGHDALLDAALSTGVVGNPQLTDLIRLLVAHGVALNTASSYNEAALSILSCSGQFNAVRVLLDAGADPGKLGWMRLHRALALGSLEDVREALDHGADIEQRDGYNRTPFLLAVQTGDIAKAELLLQRGASLHATGHCGSPNLFFAIENRHSAMFDWLLRHGAGIEQTDEFGKNPLRAAAEHDNSSAVRALLARGAKLEVEANGETALAAAVSQDVITQLLNVGADPRHLTYECQRILVGLGETCEDALLHISKDQFHSGRSRRFGTSNPERIVEPFWDAMIRSGVSAYVGAQICNPSNKIRPAWCASRFGQSLTRLPDGRIVQIAGEHEDSYDADFCIYNDVFVYHPNGKIDVFGYPAEVFPPTDFHTATMIGKFIYIIGSLGYSGTRRFGYTPICRLNSDTFYIEPLSPSGTLPGWIFGHRAMQISAHEIRITGGMVAIDDGRGESHIQNDEAFILDTRNLSFRREKQLAC